MGWIEAKKGNRKPKEGEIVLIWLRDIGEPTVARVHFEEDGFPIYTELVSVDICHIRDSVVSYWMPIPDLPKG